MKLGVERFFTTGHPAAASKIPKSRSAAPTTASASDLRSGARLSARTMSPANIPDSASGTENTDSGMSRISNGSRPIQARSERKLSR